MINKWNKYSILFQVFIEFFAENALAWNFVNIKRTMATVHVPYVVDKTCYLKPQHGPCRSEIPMYYFDAAENKCTTFMWGGCQGNGNRFDEEGDCMNFCLSSRGEGPTRPTFCSLTFDYGYCFGATDRWFFDPHWKTCKKTLYSGCGGNKNNFYSQDQCEKTCRFENGYFVRGKEKQQDDGKRKVIIINPPGGHHEREERIKTTGSTKECNTTPKGWPTHKSKLPTSKATSGPHPTRPQTTQTSQG